ncbi:GNAT family N-acetyltransferase [Sedimenticola sp.]
MPEMTIEAVNQAELPKLCNLFNLARVKNGCFPDETFEMAEFAQVIEGERLFVSRIANKITGFASVWEPDNFLHHLYVSPQYQRQGVGSALLDYCVNLFGLPMTLKCIKANVAACDFYEKHGWHIAEKAEGPEGKYFLYIRET